MAPAAGRADDEDVFWGVLLGAGAGLILGESIDGVHSSVAVPIGAIAGGLIGHELDRASYRRGWYDHYPSSYRYRPYGYYGRRVYTLPQRLRYAEPAKPKAKKKQPAPPLKAPEFHPGVDVVKVQIRLVNGTPMDVRLLRMPDDTFIGPQGETYKALPKASELTRYAGP
ncbi:MAG: glycine zipper 2TM domain-containing protein [Kiritimatiellae bacterium]|nr:glycine zipper 2TM domain-containing protein [Kiritimatiellia bacterium]